MIKFKTPSRINSSNVQAEFYRQCVEKNIPVHLEYRYDRSRFDAVVYDKTTKNILFIVEIKSYKVQQKPNLHTKQIYKYRQYDIPVVVVGRLEKVKDAVSFIKNNMDDYKNLPRVIPF